MCFPTKSLKLFLSKVQKDLESFSKNQEKCEKYLNELLDEDLARINGLKVQALEEKKFTVVERRRLFHAFERAVLIYKLLNDEEKILKLFFMDVSTKNPFLQLLLQIFTFQVSHFQ